MMSVPNTVQGFRRFLLRRAEDPDGKLGMGIVAWGVQFPDGTCATRWCLTDLEQTSVWTSLADVLASHNFPIRTIAVFLDEDGRAVRVEGGQMIIYPEGQGPQAPASLTRDYED